MSLIENRRRQQLLPQQRPVQDGPLLGLLLSLLPHLHALNGLLYSALCADGAK
jgi:hypothetical protein